MTGSINRWQLNERTSAKAYERYLVPLFFAPGVQFLIELATTERRRASSGCGLRNGHRSAYRSQRVGNHGTVIGLDLNEDMLEVAHTT